MQNSDNGHVVVGVDETPAGQNAVRYAALEARRLGTGLSIVHATPGYAPTVGAPAVPEGTLQAYGVELLESARKLAMETVSDIEVQTALVARNTTVHALADSSADALQMVLGAERRSFAGRVWTGDIVAGVAAQASCPVVVVPPEWDPAHEHGRVVVGVKDPATAADLVARGISLADELGDELVVIHAWKAPSGYDDIISRRTYAAEYGRTQKELIEPFVQAECAEHPGVSVRIDIQHAQPAHALVVASAAADRLLLSRPRHGGVFHHLGYVGRAVLNEARCPVEVHPAAGHPAGES